MSSQIDRAHVLLRVEKKKVSYLHLCHAGSEILGPVNVWSNLGSGSCRPGPIVDRIRMRRRRVAISIVDIATATAVIDVRGSSASVVRSSNARVRKAAHWLLHEGRLRRHVLSHIGRLKNGLVSLQERQDLQAC